MVGKTISHYKILEKLGEGGMGVVYKAEDTKLKREVALKFLPVNAIQGKGEKERFTREAQAAAALNHANITHIYAIEEFEEQLFIAMEYIQGKSLAELVTIPLTLEKAIDTTIQIAAGLQAAHEKGIIHRDIKSANIMITDRGVVKIMDFGLAKLANRSKMTVQGSTMGTAAYMSPEQARGKVVDQRSDIWSLGVVLYEMISGRLPFHGEYELAMVYSILNEEPEPLTALRSNIPIALDGIIAKALAKDPSVRYQHVDELPADLKALGIDSFSKSRITTTQRFSFDHTKSARQFKALAPWAIAMMLGVAVIASWLWFRQQTQPAEFKPAQMQIVLPPGLYVAVDTQYPTLALSPDGNILVFVGEENGTRRLYLRDLAAPEVRVIAGTEGASVPFFSPQGDWIGFFAGQSIKKVSVKGGMPIAMHAAWGIGVNRGATWSTEGAMILAASPNDGLARGSVTSDEEQPIGEWDHITTDPLAPYAWPYALPGGDHVLFTDFSQGLLAEACVALLNTQNAEKKILVNGGTNPRYSPTGHLLFARDGSLYALPFDRQRAEVTGSERKLFDGLMTEQNGVAQFAIGGGGTLAWIAGGFRANEDELVLVDRQGNTKILLDNGRRFLDPRFAPDGARLAVTSPTGANFDIWLYDLKRSTFDRLTSNPGEDIQPVWSPNGRHLALASEIDKKSLGLAWIPNLKAPPQRLTSGKLEFPTSWSLDGNQLAYTVVDHNYGNCDVWLLSIDKSKDPTPLLNGPAKETAGMISPDGRWIAYVSDVSGRDEVYVQSFPESGERIPISTQGGIEPVWRRDGRELFYRNGDKLMAVTLGISPKLTPGVPEVLFEGRFRKTLLVSEAANYDVSPDGNSFVMVRQKNLVTPAVIQVMLNWPEVLTKPSEAK